MTASVALAFVSLLSALVCRAAESSATGRAVTEERLRALEERVSRLEGRAPGPALVSANTDERLRALEERLARLEGKTPAPALASAPASPATTASGKTAPTSDARSLAARQFQSDTETREHALLQANQQYTERVEKVLEEFVDIKGYFRAGFGRDSEGGPQVAFQAPGASSKYRLGNEAETYGELTVAKNFYTSDAFKLDNGSTGKSSTSPIARVQTTISVFNPHQNAGNSTATDFGLPELWASIGNVSAAQPSMKFWAGNRYYRRHDIHVTDFFFSNMSGGGGGVEDFNLSLGKLAVAWIGAGSGSGVSSVPNPDASNKAGFSKSNWDLRLYDVAVPGGKGEFGLTYAYVSSGVDAAGNSAPSSDGLAFMFIHTRDGVFSPDGLNKASIQFGTGAAKTLNSGFETFTLNNNVFIRPDKRDSWRFRFTEQLIANLNDSFSVGPVFVYQFTDYAENHDKVEWYSIGVRPIWHFNQHVSIAAEAGWDRVKDEAAGTNDGLFKFTLAPQISLGGRFMSRPVLRLFATYAKWGDDFVGKIGGLDYATQNDGFTFGVQMEAWW